MSVNGIAGCIWLFLALLLLGAHAGAQQEATEQFDLFCARHFGAEKEEEVYRAFGKDLKVLDDGRWMHVSETSACMAWETNLPTKTFVEYGTTARYGMKTDPSGRYFFLHVHYLRNLEPDKTYHYRLVSVDERGNRVDGKDETFATRTIAGVVRIPDDVDGPPYVCDKPGTTYLLTKNVVSDSTGINVVADGVTLDLGGHTVVYENKADADDPTVARREWGWHPSQKNCGVRTADGRKGLRIVNGTIRMGAGDGDGSDGGHNPVFLRRPRQTEIAGLTCEFAGTQVTGIRVMNAYEGVRVHHNVIVDRGTKINNRHQGMDAIAFYIGQVESVSLCDHNLVARTRHRGISTSSNTELASNEIYVDSFATNSYGIIYYSNRGAKNLKLLRNRIFGTGFHPIGIGSGQGWSDVLIAENYIQMQGTERDDRWRGGEGGGEAGTVGEGGFHPVNGIRLQRPRGNIVHERNTVVVRGRGEGCMMRGLWLVPDEQTAEGIILRDNRIKTIAEDAKATGFAVAFGGMNAADNPVVLEGNTIASNLTNLQFNDNYSHGGRFLLRKNTLVRIGDDVRYRTIRMGWDGRVYESTGQVLVDTVLEGGATFGSVSFDGAERTAYDFAVAWTLTLEAPAGIEVAVRDREGGQAFVGTMPQNGRLALSLIEYMCTRRGRVAKTPHEVALTRDGRTTKRSVAMDAPRVLKIEGIE